MMLDFMSALEPNHRALGQWSYGSELLQVHRWLQLHLHQQLCLQLQLRLLLHLSYCLLSSQFLCWLVCFFWQVISLGNVEETEGGSVQTETDRDGRRQELQSPQCEEIQLCVNCHTWTGEANIKRSSAPCLKLQDCYRTS